MNKFVNAIVGGLLVVSLAACSSDAQSDSKMN